MKHRIWELDMLRGLGILLVVFFHSAWNICYEYQLSVIDKPWVTALVYLFAGMLIFVSGSSSYLGKNTLIRGLITFGCGMLATLITYFLFPESFIKFGILHLLGVSMLAAWAVKQLHLPFVPILAFAFAALATGMYIGGIRVHNEFLFWLGLISENYSSLDHYPILPWMGVFFAGFVFSSVFYKDRVSPFTKGKYHENPLTFAGRYSLAIYLFHQPFVYFLMYCTPFKGLLDHLFAL